jgi:hypothetical protein
MDLHELHPQYVTNHSGKKISVILSIAEFNELIEDLKDLAIVAKRREEPTISHKKLLAELKKDGLI